MKRYLIPMAIGCIVGALLSGCNAEVNVNDGGTDSDRQAPPPSAPHGPGYTEVLLESTPNYTSGHNVTHDAVVSLPTSLTGIHGIVPGLTAEIQVGPVICQFISSNQGTANTNKYNLTGCNMGISILNLPVQVSVDSGTRIDMRVYNPYGALVKGRATYLD